VGNLSYALLAAHFPSRLAGRVNTALNVATFAGAFALQWGFGVTVDFLISRGAPSRDAYRYAYIIVLAMQAASHLWFRCSGKRRAVPGLPVSGGESAE